MDTCVPSPNLLSTPFATSPHSVSIYELERQSTFCGGYKVNSDMNFTEEEGMLDDNVENSSLKDIITPDILSSMASSSSGFTYTNKNLFEDKLNPEETRDHSFGSPYIQLDMDTDFSGMISEILNVDSNDSKFSTFDFELVSNPPSSCQTPVLSESKSDFSEMSTIDTFVPLNKELSLKERVGVDFLHKKFPMKQNFPPRTSQPPIVVVAPVKVPEGKSFDNGFNSKVKINDSEVEEKIAATQNTKLDILDQPPQTVPLSFGISNQGGCPVKIEPVSPNGGLKGGPLKRSSADKDGQHDVYCDSLSTTKSKRRRYDSGSSGHISDDGDEDDNEYSFNMDDDSDDDNSDLDADLAHMKPGGCESLIGGGKKQKQYFWQYNVQAKGPKGTRLKLAVENPSDPHVLNCFEDPVFDEGNTMVAGIRHGGKARKGDGNEVTPNPHKLFKIGHQLLRLNKKINACQLGSDVPLAKRNESRKEKNKLASRACRLKKKAQHEANKIKLHGLEIEHGQINSVLRLLWPQLREKVKSLQNKSQNGQARDINLTNTLTDFISSNLKSMVAGHTTDYVNNIILEVERGDLKGGLNVKSRKT